MAVPNIFGSATSAIPLSQLDQNFATAITLGNTAVYLGNTTTSLGNVTLTNVTISSGNVTVTGANVSGTANVSTLIVTGNQTSLGNVAITGNVSANIATFGAGSNTSPSITTTGDTNTGIFFPAADQVAITTGGTQRAVVDASGNVGIGTASPQMQTTGYTGLEIYGNTNGAQIKLSNSTTGSGSGNGFDLILGQGSSDAYLWNRENAATIFATNNLDRMRIDSSGNLLVGTTSNPDNYRLYVNGTNDRGMQLDAPSGSGVYTTLNFAQNATIQTQLFWFSTTDEFIIQNTSGGVKLTNGATSWASASDERLKDIIEPITNAAEKVSSLRAVIGKYKTDAEDKRRTFLIAQDVQAVLPEAVYSAQQARSEDETEYLHLQYTDVIPLLVAAIKEQQVIIVTMREELDVLKAKVGA